MKLDIEAQDASCTEDGIRPGILRRLPVNPTVEMQVFHKFEETMPLREEWDGFIEKEKGEIFLTYDWCRVWWKYYGRNRNLSIFIYRHEGEIVGILPVFQEKIGLGPYFVRVVKMVGTDFTPITITFPVKHEFIDVVLPMFIEELDHAYHWDILHLGAICGRYEHTESLLEALHDIFDKSHQIQIKASSVQTYFHIEDSWEKQIAGLSQRQRTKTRRIYKELKQKNTSLASFFAVNGNWPKMFDSFVQMHQSHWQSIGMAGHFGDWPSSYEFHREIAGIQLGLDRLRLLEIQLDGKCIGYEYIYKLGSTYFWFLGARSDLGKDSHIDFHRVAFGEKVEKAIRDGIDCIDAMRGHYEYKIVMGGQLKPVNDILVFSKRPLTSLKIRIFRLMIWSLNAWYLKIWRRRIAPRLRIKPKPFKPWLIRSTMFSY